MESFLKKLPGQRLAAGPDDSRLVPKPGVKHIFLVKNHYKNPDTVYYSSVTETVEEKRTREGEVFFEYRRPLPVLFLLLSLISGRITKPLTVISEQIRGLGAGFSLDDFGTGYSSLS